MSSHVPRRGFLARLAAAAGAASATFAVPVVADAQSQTHDLDKWIEEAKGRHKQLFDCVTKTHIGEMQYGINFFTASTNDYGYKDEDSSLMFCLRHDATPFAYNDAMWEKYKIGEVIDLAAPPSGGGRGGDPPSAVDSNAVKATKNPQTRLITTLAGRGVRFGACALATTRYSGMFARKVSAQQADVRADLAANLVPNCRLVPSGVVFVNRAQEKGFTYLHVG
jgi:intracellular sulfur oxidation DsrE/DsrF family protein